MSCDTYIYKRNGIKGTLDYILFHQDTISSWELGEMMMQEIEGKIGEVIGENLKSIFETLKIEPNFKIEDNAFYQVEISY